MILPKPGAAADAKTELERLPGCSTKISRLFQEWKTTGTLGEVEMTTSDPKLSVIALFYEIWGVGDTTAREFYRKGKLRPAPHMPLHTVAK